MRIIRLLSGRSAYKGYGWTRISDGCAYPFRPNYRFNHNYGLNTGDGLPPVIELTADSQEFNRWVIGQHHYVTTRVGADGIETKISQYQFSQFFFIPSDDIEFDTAQILRIPLLLQPFDLSIKEYQEVSEKDPTPYPPAEVTIPEVMTSINYESMEEASFMLVVWQRCWERFNKRPFQRLIAGFTSCNETPKVKLDLALRFSAQKLTALFPDVVKRIISIAYGVPVRNAAAIEHSVLVFVQDADNKAQALFDINTGKLIEFHSQRQSEEEVALAEALYRGEWPALYIEMKHCAPEDLKLHANYNVLITLAGLEYLPLTYERIMQARKDLEKQMPSNLLFHLLLQKEKQLLTANEKRTKNTKPLIPFDSALEQYFILWSRQEDEDEAADISVRYLETALQEERAINVLDMYLAIAKRHCIQQNLDTVCGFSQGMQRITECVLEQLIPEDLKVVKNIIFKHDEGKAYIESSGLIKDLWETLLTKRSDDLVVASDTVPINDIVMNAYLDLISDYQLKKDIVTPLVSRCIDGLSQKTLQKLNTHHECSEKDLSHAVLEHLNRVGNGISPKEINTWRNKQVGQGKDFNDFVQRWYESLLETNPEAREQARHACKYALEEGWDIEGERNRTLRREILRDMFNQEFGKCTDLTQITNLSMKIPYLSPAVYDEVFQDDQPGSTKTIEYTDCLIGNRETLVEASELLLAFTDAERSEQPYYSLLQHLIRQIRDKFCGDYAVKAAARLLREIKADTMAVDFQEAEKDLNIIEGDSPTNQTRKARAAMRWATQIISGHKDTHGQETDFEAIHDVIRDLETKNILNIAKKQGDEVFYTAAIDLAKLQGNEKWAELYWQWVAGEGKSQIGLICFICRELLGEAEKTSDRKAFICYISKEAGWKQLENKLQSILKAKNTTLKQYFSENSKERI